MKKLIIATGIFVFLISTGASAKSPSIKADMKTNISGKWELQTIQTDTGLLSASGSGAFIQFDLETGRISGKGGCNNFGGAYQSQGYAISFSKIFSTKMFCVKTQQVENAFLKILR